MGNFYIIAGLGNPGKQYEGSRHNVGFSVIDSLAKTWQIPVTARFGHSLAGKGTAAGKKVILLKPLTYMNRSGEAVREAIQFYKADPASDLLVISDDIDLAAGALRIRVKGSAGGHNGLKDIIRNLGTEEFCRIRVGVGGKPDRSSDLADYVLGHFAKEERAVMEEAVQRAALAAACIIEKGPDIAMNLYNTRRERKKAHEDADIADAGTGGIQGDHTQAQ